MTRFIFSVISVIIVAPCATSAGLVQEKTTENPFADRMLAALFNPNAQNALELVDEQKSHIKKSLASINELRKEYGRQLKEYSLEATKEQVKSKRQEIIKLLETAKKKEEQSILDMLLPHQKQRLGQVTAQLMLGEAAKKNSLGVLAPEMIEWLEIDQEQADRLREKAKELRKELTEKMARWNEHAKEELLKELSSDQRKKYKALIGEPLKKAPKSR